MLLKEYNEAFHISSEKDISFREGQESERLNTERERQRADAEKLRADSEQQRADAAQLQADSQKQRADTLQLQNTILTYKIQGKSEEMIARLTNCTIEEIQAVLAPMMAD